jgi:hypothetical protein
MSVPKYSQKTQLYDSMLKNENLQNFIQLRIQTFLEGKKVTEKSS